MVFHFNSCLCYFRNHGILIFWALIMFITTEGFQRKTSHCRLISGYSNSFSLKRIAPLKDHKFYSTDIKTDRQRSLQTFSKLLSTVFLPLIASTSLRPVLASQLPQKDDILSIPLSKYDGVYCMNYTVNSNQYRGIIDTGSPFLIVPSVNTRIWGYTKKESPPYLESGIV